MKPLNKFVGAVVDIGLVRYREEFFEIDPGVYFSGEEFWQIDDLSFLLIEYFGWEEKSLKLFNKFRGDNCFLPYLGSDNLSVEITTYDELIHLQYGLLMARVDLEGFMNLCRSRKQIVCNLMYCAISIDLRWRITDDYERGDFKGTCASYLISLCEWSDDYQSLEDCSIDKVDEFVVDYLYKLFPKFCFGIDDSFDGKTFIRIHLKTQKRGRGDIDLDSLFLFLDKEGGNRDMKRLVIKYFILNSDMVGLYRDDAFDIKLGDLLSAIDGFSVEKKLKMFKYIIDEW
jgi:hypothetical protein